MLKVRPLGVPLERFLVGIEVPMRQQNSTVGSGQLGPVVSFPQRQVVVVLHPQVHLIAHLQLDVLAESAVDRLHLVGLVGRDLVVVQADELEEINVVRLGLQEDGQWVMLDFH